MIYLKLAAEGRKHQKQLKVWVNQGSYNRLPSKRMRASTLLFTLPSSEENKIKGDRRFCSFLLKKSQPLLLLRKLKINTSVPKKISILLKVETLMFAAYLVWFQIFPNSLNGISALTE